MYQGAHIVGMPGSDQSPVPIIRLYGVTKEGISVCCNVHGFTPYFFISVPESFRNDQVEVIRAALDVCSLYLCSRSLSAEGAKLRPSCCTLPLGISQTANIVICFHVIVGTVKEKH